MGIKYENENTMRGLTDQERAELDSIIIDHVLNDWDGSGLDLDNFRYVADIRFKGMTFSVRIEGREWFFMGEDGESFEGFTSDVEDGICVKRIR